MMYLPIYNNSSWGRRPNGFRIFENPVVKPTENVSQLHVSYLSNFILVPKLYYNQITYCKGNILSLGNNCANV